MLTSTAEGTSVAAETAAVEKSVRTNLAALYRLAVHYKWDSHIFNHLAARVPGTPYFLVKPHSLMFHEITASNLLKLRLDGQPMDESSDVNSAGFTIHTGVLNARPELNYTIHIHSNAGVAMSARKDGIKPFYQRSMIFYNRLSYHDFEGVATEIDEATRIARDLGPKNRAVMLRNHGLLTCGAGPGECLSLMRYLVESCEIQLMLEASGGEINIPPHEVCEKTALHYERFQSVIEKDEWAAYLRVADSLDPSFRN
jgi:ribulose-5-phosphate 4-epimerase/fuculose-1-phosphate aldolase